MLSLNAIASIVVVTESERGGSGHAAVLNTSIPDATITTRPSLDIEKGSERKIGVDGAKFYL